MPVNGKRLARHAFESDASGAGTQAATGVIA